MKVVYCANCGTRLNIMRRAMPKLGRIIDVVEYHICPDEPVEIDLTPVDLPSFTESEGNNKFVKILNDLQPPSILGAIGADDLRDRRPLDQVKTESKSTAPTSLGNLINSLEPSAPTKPLIEEPEDV